MKAIRIHEFGGTEVMRIEEVERPAPATDEILARVFARGIHPVDCAIDESIVNATVSNVYPFTQFIEANREMESHHVRGKLVLEIFKKVSI